MLYPYFVAGNKRKMPVLSTGIFAKKFCKPLLKEAVKRRKLLQVTLLQKSLELTPKMNSAFLLFLFVLRTACTSSKTGR
jgi:hypothetical protein